MCIRPSESWRVANNPLGLRRLRRQLDELELRPERVVLEATGKYHRLVFRTLSAWGYGVVVVNPLRARLFAEACGVLAKTDRIDARLLAVMGHSLSPQPTLPAPLLHSSSCRNWSMPVVPPAPRRWRWATG